MPVHVGDYLDNIDIFLIRDSFCTSTFFIGFRWIGDRALDPGKTFQSVDAKIEKKELLDERYGADAVNYQRYRVSAKVIKFFNTTRVPLDDPMLNLHVEDGSHDATRLRYVADTESNYNSRVKVTDYNIGNFATVVKTHAYKTAYGDPAVAPGSRTSFTERAVALDVKRSSMGVYLKSFIGLFAGVLLTFTSLAIRASEGGPRVSMPVASYFGAVANSYLATALLPSSRQFGLVEYVSFLGHCIIFACLLTVVVSMYIWHVVGDKELSKALNRTTLVSVGTAYTAVNVALPFFAFMGWTAIMAAHQRIDAASSPSNEIAQPCHRPR